MTAKLNEALQEFVAAQIRAAKSTQLGGHDAAAYEKVKVTGIELLDALQKEPVT